MNPCVESIMLKSGLSRQDAETIYTDILSYKTEIETKVGHAEMMAELNNYIAEVTTEAEKAALQRRRRAVLTAEKYTETQARLAEDVKRTGKSYNKVLEDDIYMIESTARGLRNKHLSPVAKIMLENKTLNKLLRNRKTGYDHMLSKELHEPGSIKDPAIVELAQAINKANEDVRLALNDGGLDIGKIENYGIKHSHDRNKISKNPLRWREALRTGVDWDKSFPWLSELMPKEKTTAINKIMDAMESHLLKGKAELDANIADDILVQWARKKHGRRVGRALEKSRQLIFKNADAWNTYSDEFAPGGVLAGFYDDMRRKTNALAAIRTYGPNPEATLMSISNKRLDDLRNINVGIDKKILKEVKELEKNNLVTGSGDAGIAWNIVSGKADVPENFTAAQIMNGLRLGVSMSKLGGAVISNISDLPVSVMHVVTRYGRNLIEAWGDKLRFTFGGLSPEARQAFAGDLEVYTDTVIGNMAARHGNVLNLNDGMSRLSDAFFKGSLLTGWTDINKRGAAVMLGNILGKNANMKFADLHPEMQYTLKEYGVDKYWDIIRANCLFKDNNGRTYVVPNKIDNLPTRVIDATIADEIAAVKKSAKEKGFDPTQTIERMRREAEFKISTPLHRMFAAEVDKMILTPGARTKKWTTGGIRPGTLAGETLRTITQFKSFPIAFIQQVLSPMTMGRANKDIGGRLSNVALLMAQTTAFGYIAMEIKRMARNEKPYFLSENPDWKKAAVAAFLQGGGGGLYGDFLFSEYNRFGGGLPEALSGPLVSGYLGDFDKLRGLSVGGELKKADVINTAINNAPFINMFYTRAALDYAFMYSMRESMSPGWLRRKTNNMRRDGGREWLVDPNYNRLRTFE